MLAALHALETLDLLQVRHEADVRRIARQLGTDVERLPCDQRDALAAYEVRSSDAIQHRPQLTLGHQPAVRFFRQTAHIVDRLADPSSCSSSAPTATPHRLEASHPIAGLRTAGTSVRR
jgi:hypothetical protein